MIPITLQIEENKVEEFLQFITKLNYIKIDSSDELFFKNLKISLLQMKEMQKSNKPKQNLEDFLNGL